MIEQHVDHGRHHEGEVDLLARDGGQKFLRLEALQQMHRAAAQQRGHDLGAGDMGDRRRRQVARHGGKLEVGGDRDRHGGGRAVAADGALGLAGRAAGVADDGVVVGIGEIDRRGRADFLRGAHDVAAEIRPAHGEHDPQPVGRLGGELAAPLRVRPWIDDERRGLGILDDVEMIAQRAQRMQPGRHQAEARRGHAGAPGLGAVGAQEGHGLALGEPGRRHRRLQAADQVEGGAIGEAAAVPRKGRAIRKAHQGAQDHGRAGGRLGDRLVHLVLRRQRHRCLWHYLQ